MTSGRCSEAGAAIGIGSPPQTIRQRSATMNEMPSVTSTCPSAFPARGRRMNRSTSPPNAATTSPLSNAASQRFGTSLSAVTPKYAPSMNNEPWVRFAIRISPKISENPAASRNKRPPRARLFNVWTIQNCMSMGSEKWKSDRRPRPVTKINGDPVAFVQTTLDSLPAFAGTKGRGNDGHELRRSITDAVATRKLETDGDRLRCEVKARDSSRAANRVNRPDSSGTPSDRRSRTGSH